ncbi:trypsin-like peptidase domain-containing protein [Rhodoferax sp.]|uniref:S1C family serine protease n=1 Tax=Rhodoferax sp. TaxID=50421 RepID=UPI002763EC49|nr:trypsin-like peptidase domain-containing protein [Rhodoferax sp.]
MILAPLRRVLAALILAPLVAHAAPASAQAGSAELAPTISIANSVVKVFSTARYPDPFKPWTKQAPKESTGSGVVIEGRRILTNAHVVLYASQVQVQANQGGEKLSATVEAISPGIDLAILKLDDESFFDKHAPLARASTLPEIKEAVLAYGYPTGGTSLSITKGIVSRIEYATYNFPTSGLRIQIDAAINPGNSGGPAVSGDKMIGLAFSRLNDAQNIGYIIPNEEVELFLGSVEAGTVGRKASLMDEFQTLENPTLRAFLKLDKSVKGLVVHRAADADPAYPLQKWDVVTHIGGTPIDEQGMVKLGSDLRVNFRYLIHKVARDGKVPLTVVRAGQSLRVDVPVSHGWPLLIPDLQGRYPSYFVYGPLVFSSATAQYAAFLSGNANTMLAFSFIRSPLVTRRGDPPGAQREELVVIASPFFPHKLAKGYSNPSAGVVDTVNGVPIRSLRHLVTVLRDIKDEFVVVQTDNRGGESMVFPHKEMLAATEDILTDNGVRAQGSPDLLEVWRQAATKP